jgi:hypothetical protein
MIAAGRVGDIGGIPYPVPLFIWRLAVSCRRQAIGPDHQLRAGKDASAPSNYMGGVEQALSLYGISVNDRFVLGKAIKMFDKRFCSELH